MAFDGIITAAVAKELDGLLTGGKVEKIYQPEPDELIFHIRARGGSYKLCASCGSSRARVHLLTDPPPLNPRTPAAFCMLLRKHLAGGRIAKIARIDTERILEIGVDTVNEMGFPAGKIIYIEIMGKHSNIILVDAASRRVVDSVKRVSAGESRARQILPGRPYELPPSQHKTPLDRITPETIEALCRVSPSALSKSLLDGIQGISPGIAGRLADLADAVPLDGAEATAARRVYEEIVAMRERLATSAFTPVVYLDEDGQPLDFHIFELPAFAGAREKRAFDTINECLEFYHARKEGANRFRQKSADLKKTVSNRLSKLYLKKQRLSEDLLKAAEADTYRLYGELLTAGLHLVEAGRAEARLLNYYDGTEIVIPLDTRFAPSKNAQNYFKKYGKAKTAAKEKTARLLETDKEIHYLETVDSFIENAADTEEIESLRDELTEQGYLRKRKTREKPAKIKPAPFAYKTGDGFRVLAGRNNRENDLLTFSLAGRTDLWLHAKDLPGSHVILFTEGGQPTEQAIFEAASVAAYHSKARSSENVPVDYAPVKHVKKPAGAKPGMVIFTNNRTVYVRPGLPAGFPAPSC